MRILVIGSGGREHAICDAFGRSGRVSDIFCAPGNAGIEQVADCVPIESEDIIGLANFAEREQIDVTFVGGETSLALGVVDEFEKRGLRIIGASKNAARLEASKSFAKDFMLRHAIPTAKFFTANSPAEAIEILESGHFGGASSRVVVKADGLAAGKGVIVAMNRTEAVDACNKLSALVGAGAAEKIVLEEFLEGSEVSLLMFADGKDFAIMPPVRDHKRIGEGDTGPNTGGMGTITDSGLLTAAQSQQIMKDIIEPTLAGCIDEGFPFRGILFLGLMMTTGGPKLLEYNVRFGDPETQAILVRLESDLAEICEAMLDGTMADRKIEWHDGNSACVVLAAEGYPQKPRTGDEITGIADAQAIGSVRIFHAGTAVVKDDGGKIKDEGRVPGPKSLVPERSTAEDVFPSSFVTAGGRVLGVTATGATLEDALSTAYAGVGRISWRGMQFRRDIGR
ncbi:MAG: phosphoribosylamine--glycine ligase [Acidobacteriota bacterium]